MNVTLHDGRVVPSDSREWLLETLARWVLGLPTLERRREFLAGFTKQNGEASAKTLRERMTALHEQAKGNGAARQARPQPRTSDGGGPIAARSAGQAGRLSVMPLKA